MKLLILFLIIGAAWYLGKRTGWIPFAMMATAASAVPPGFPKRTKTIFVDSAIEATQNPIVSFVAQEGMVPLSLRFTSTALDRTSGNETYVISLTDDGTKVSTDNDAATAAHTTYEATFAKGTYIAKDSLCKIVLTLGGTTPSITGTLIELDYLEG